jgi:hypothetical protein
VTNPSPDHQASFVKESREVNQWRRLHALLSGDDTGCLVNERDLGRSKSLPLMDEGDVRKVK